MILGIETTCDETAAAVVRNGKEILSNAVMSQADQHVQYRGVFPEYASRNHVDLILPAVEKAMEGIDPSEIEAIAVANQPGLMGPLLMGVTAAKALALAWNKPLIGVNHIDAHLYAAMMEVEPQFPALGVVVSGGHTHMVRIDSMTQFEVVSSTVDDAIGEAFDKVAALLDLPYPGGPEIEKLAKEGNPNAYPFKPGRVKSNPLAFSFSGLKTQVLYAVKGSNSNKYSQNIIDESEKKDIAASFQMTALSDICNKAIKGAQALGLSQIFVGGGVTNSSKLKEIFASHTSPTLSIHFPPSALTTDNGAMIAGYAHYLSPEPLNLCAKSRSLNFLV